jgi:uncharacterized membrane protein YfcA
MMLLFFLIIALGAFITGLSKGGLGGALGSLVTPMFALIMPAPVAVGLTLPLLLAGDACAVYAHWRGWDKRIVLAILPSSILGVVVGSLLLSSMSPVTLQHGLGVVALVYTACKIWERRSGRVSSTFPGQTHILGSGAGFASTVANAGGPIFTIHLLTLRLMPSVFVGTSALYYALLNLAKVPAYLNAHILSPQAVEAVAWAMPLIPMGVWSGVILDRHIDMPTFEIIILIFLAVTGVALLLK